jgi:predicted kinase
VVIVITGPIASGKSTVARALYRELAGLDVRVAVIDLDAIEAILSPDGPSPDLARWTVARRATATLAGTFLTEGVAVVIADGSFNQPSDRAAFDRHLGADVSPLYVTLRVTFEEALHRAQGDPTRGVSRDPAFLGAYFADSTHVPASLPATDIVIDTESVSPSAAAAEIAKVVRSRH